MTPGGVGEGRNDPRWFPPTVGELPIAMLFVDFADVKSAEDPRVVYESFVPQTVEWYRKVSYGRLRVVVTPVLHRISLGGRLADYIRGGGTDPTAGLRKILEESAAAVDAQVDFGGFRAIHVVLPFAAVDRVGGSGVLLLEQPLRIDGAEIPIFALLYDGGGAEPDFLAHETGHILGLPDLYVVTSRDSFHRWDIMASAILSRGLFAWHRWKLGWLDPAQIACLGSRERRITATLTPLERAGGLKAIVFRRGRYAYVAEVRNPVTFPGNRRCKGGVLIYVVEFGAANGEADIRLVRARRDTAELRGKCGPQAAAPLGRGRGEVSRVRAFGLQFEVLAKLRGGSYRVRVTKTR